MNRKITLIFFSLIILLLFSCGTTRNIQNTTPKADEYISEKNGEEISKNKNEKKSVDKKEPYFKRYDSLLKMGNKGDFEKFDDTTFFTKDSFGKLKQIDADIVYYFKDTSLGISSNYQGVYYFCLFNETNITDLENAYNKYLKDFENKKLIRKSTSTIRTYGKIPVTLRWGAIPSSTPNYGYGNAQIGYCFIDKSPYFSITVDPVDNEIFKESSLSTSRNSNTYTVYFTKAQMSYLLESLLNHSFIEVEYTEETEVDKDEY